MNKSRRKQLDAALAIMVEAAAKVAEARAAIDEVRADEQEAYDNLSEGAQAGDNGEAMQSAISAMDDALSSIDALDIAKIAQDLSACDVDADLPEAKISQAEADERRQARLPQWAKDQIARAEAATATVVTKLEGLFPEATNEAKELVVDDYESPVRGRVLPARQIAIPSLGLKIEVNARENLLEVTKDGFGRLKIIPGAANVLYIGTEER